MYFYVQQLNNKMHALQDLNRKILTLCSVKEIEQEIEDSEAVDAKILKKDRAGVAFFNDIYSSK